MNSKRVFPKAAFLAAALFFFAAGISFAQNGLQAFQKLALGKWQVEEEETAIEITENGISVDGDTIKYSFDKNNIYLDFDGYIAQCAYTLIDKDTFRVVFENDTVVFKKLDNNNFTMSVDDDTLNFGRMQGIAAAPSGLQALQKLAIGQWEVVEEADAVEITGNEIRIDNEIMKYSFGKIGQKNLLYLEFDNQAIRCEYALVDKDAFRVEIEEDTFIIKRLDNNSFTLTFVGYDDILNFRRIRGSAR